MVDTDEPYTLSMAVVAAISCNLFLVVQAVVPLLPLPPPSPELVELPPELQVLHLEEEEEEHQLLPLPLLQHPLADLEDKSLSTVTTTTSTTTTHAPILTSFKTGTSAQSLSILNQASQGFPHILPILPIHPIHPTPHTPHPIPQLVSEDLLPLHHPLHLLVPESLTEFSAPEDSDLEEVPCLVAALALSAIVVGMIKLITPKPLAVVTITDVRFFFIVILLKKLYIQN